MTRPELIKKILAIDSFRDKALASFIYLSGCRISEILGTMKIIPKKKEEVIIEPLLKESVEVIPENDLIVIHNVPCLKRKYAIPRRNIPIVISHEKPLSHIFANYHRRLRTGEALFNITRQRAWQIIKKELGIYNHLLIHQRCTYLVSYKSFSDQHLRAFRGWSNTIPASVYTHLQYRDLAQKMR